MLTKPILTLFLFLSSYTICHAQKSATWTLVFEDHFDGTLLDYSLWHPNDQYGTVYEDRYRYSLNNDSFKVEDGFLHLTARKLNPFMQNALEADHRICNKDERYFEQLSEEAKEACRSGLGNICDSFPEACRQLILLDGKKNFREFRYKTDEVISNKSFRFGKFEMRFKLQNSPYNSEKAKGHWPAFWLFGWDNEIDIFEIDNTDKLNYKAGSYVYRDHGVYGINYLHNNRKAILETDDEKFYTVGIEWYPPGVYGKEDYIVWYIDGEAFLGNSLRNARSNGKQFPKDDVVIPRSLNIRIGTYVDDWDGRRGWNGPPNDNTVFPYSMIIDYVKVWQYLEFDENCNNDLTDNSCENLWYHSNIGPNNDWYPELSDGLIYNENVSFGSNGDDCELWKDIISIGRSSNSPPDVNDNEIYYLDPISNSLDIRACNSIVLKPNNFRVEEGAQFTAKIIENPIDCSTNSIQPMQLTGSIFYAANFCTDKTNPLRFRYNCADSYSAKVFSAGHNLSTVHKSSGDVDKYGLIYPWSGEGASEDGIYYLEIEVSNGSETKTYLYNIEAQFYNCDYAVTKMEVFPNPFKQNIQTSFSLRKNTDVKITLSNISGQLLQEQEWKNRPAGDYTETFDTGQLNAGVYICSLHTEEEVVSKKVVKVLEY